MKWAYTAIVKARLFYGCIVWGPSLRQTGNRDKIDSINKLMVAILSNTRRSTPRLALEIIYNLPPNHILIIKEGMLSLIRNRYVIYSDWSNKNKSCSFSGHIRYWEKKAEKYDMDLESSDKTRQCTWDKHFSINKASLLTQKLPIQSQINIYTDGSITGLHVGCGFVIYKGNHEMSSSSIRLPEYCTVYQAEVMAINLAAQEAVHILGETDKKILRLASSNKVSRQVPFYVQDCSENH